MRPAVTTLSHDFRVALVLSELRPGGMERVVVHLAHGLSARGIKVLVICLQGEGVLSSELKGTPVNLLAVKSFTGKDLCGVFRLRQALIRFKPCVINLHDYASLPYAISANAIGGGAHVLFTAHGLLYEGFENRRNRNRILSRFLQSFSAVSEKVADRHRNYLGWCQPIEIIANGVPEYSVDVSLRESTRNQFKCNSKTFLFLAVGNPRPEKGFEDLVDAVAILRSNYGNFENFLVVVAGNFKDDAYCGMLLKKVRENQLADHIRFIGFRQDTAALYAAADAFVLPSRSEGLPMVILEAMMAGLPVVATGVGGIPAAVGEHVILVDPVQPQQLAQAMDQMMKDEAMRVHLSNSGRAYVEKHYGVKRMVDGYVKWYESVLENRQRCENSKSLG